MNKKAVSLLISYVLLIVIAMTLATILYFWLQTYIPDGNQLKCPEDVSLIIKDSCCGKESCDPNNDPGYFTLEFQNKGFHYIDGAYIRFSNKADKKPIYPPIPQDKVKSPGTFLFGIDGLEPGETMEVTFDYFVNIKENLGDSCENSELNCAEEVALINIQPYVYDVETDELAICEDAIITQELVCSF